MHPGNIITTIALPAPALDGAFHVGTQALPGLRDDSWIHAALRKPYQFAAKRAFDVVVSGLALAFLLPFFAAIAATIVIENRGPVFFTQMRWGRGGKLIRIYKFRSMRTDMCDESGVAQTKENDPRVTRIGAFLRKSNLDELPQLINIFMGDMSLVGPRCHVPGMLAAGRLYEDLVQEYHLRHLVRPGLTGLAQVNGFRGPTDREDLARGRVAHDLEYIRSFSFLKDIEILVKTAIKEIKGGTGF
ncbi:sugar transferase [Rhizobium sp. KVB221]|uniref:Sugar transferase n=1 Tax=Rhizobium setariae TaxID=2801340 RepID=A0A936YKS9_9HYPH|nr:sugar transferase [Rhizobium setariae]MBL0370547.1 sugar transferase [Rhizobium setariae]